MGNSTGFGGGGGGIFAYGNVTVTSSTISGNSNFGFPAYGGGIWAGSNVTVTSSTISGNSAGSGGGIYAHGDVMVSSSTISGNSASYGGGGGGGGGIIGGNVTVISSTISNNTSYNSYGGGISGGNVTVTSSTISGNSASYGGGGISSNSYSGDVTVTSSTISGNSASHGGGIFVFNDVTVTSSTISGNTSGRLGGGIYAHSDVTITSTTITDNHAKISGGGIWLYLDSSTAVLSHTIVAGNSRTTDGSPPVADDLAGNDSYELGYSLIGDNTGTSLVEAPVGSPDSNGNLIGGPIHGIINPLLGPLADNGGPTQTHALLPGSPAIDAGDPTIQQDPDQFDQRGDPFLRVADGDLPDDIVIDMGAYEAQMPPSADFDSDHDVDGSDFLAWQRGYGTTVGATRPDGNSDDDEDVDASDLAAWDVSFGDVTVPVAIALSVASDQPSPQSQQATTSVVQASTLDLRAELVDAAIVMDQTLRSESGARLGSQSPLSEDHFDWVSHRARWGQSPVWQGTGEIADHSFRGQINKVNEGRFYRNPDAVDEELLDKLFAEEELISLL